MRSGGAAHQIYKAPQVLNQAVLPYRHSERSRGIFFICGQSNGMRNFLNGKPATPDTQKSPFLRKGPASEAMLGGIGRHSTFVRAAI